MIYGKLNKSIFVPSAHDTNMMREALIHPPKSDYFKENKVKLGKLGAQEMQMLSVCLSVLRHYALKLQASKNPKRTPKAPLKDPPSTP